MTTMKNLFALIMILLLASCATGTRFPVSGLVPAADITALKKKDKHNNYTLNVTARNLASVDRVDPAKKTYVVWVVTKNEGTKNIGQLSVRNAKTSSLKSLTAFDFTEVFITAEEQGDIVYPSGPEITRVFLK